MRRDVQPFTINGRFSTQAITGVQRYAHEIVRGIDKILAGTENSSIKATMIVPPKGVFDHRLSSISIKTTAAGSGIAWEQFVLPFYRRGPLLNLCNQGPLSLADQVVCIHDLNTLVAPQSYSRAFRMLYGVTQPALARRAAKLVTVSRYSAEMLAHFGYCSLSKVRVIPNGHEHVNRWNAAGSSLALSQRSRPYVFVLGSQAKHKNVEMLFSIAPALDDLGVDLLIVGGAADIFSEISPTKRAPNIVRLGFVSDDDLAALFKHALCFAFPSLTEGFGLPVLEALALGCPVVASNIPALREVASESALYADPELPASWFDRISDLKRQTGLREELREKGPLRARLFSWASGAQAYLDLLSEMAHYP
jgi:glycosyltransferase involved in cell wall biosynthesis